MFGGSPLQYTPLGYAQATVGAVAAGLPSIPSRAKRAVITIETNGVRWRDDGTAPTAAVGHPIAAGAPAFEYEGVLGAVQFIRSGAADATLNVTYYG